MLFLCLSNFIFSQENWDLRFDEVINEDGDTMLYNVRVVANNRFVEIQHYLPDESTPKIVYDSTSPTHKVEINSDSTIFQFILPRDTLTVSKTDGKVECKISYYGSYKYYRNESDFKVIENHPRATPKKWNCIYIRNPNFDFLVKGEKNIILYETKCCHQTAIRLESDNGIVTNGIGQAVIEVNNNKPTTLKIMYGDEPESVYSKTFPVINLNESLPKTKNSLIPENVCANIYRKENTETLFVNEINSLLVSNSEYLKNTILVIDNGEVISFEKGVLKLKPTNLKPATLQFLNEADNSPILITILRVIERN